MPHVPHFNDPDHWRQRAEESRALAEQMNDEAVRKMILGIADDYDKLAARAALRLNYPELLHPGIPLVRKYP